MHYSLIVGLGIFKDCDIINIEDAKVLTSMGEMSLPLFPVQATREDMHEFVDSFFDKLEQ